MKVRDRTADSACPADSLDAGASLGRARALGVHWFALLVLASTIHVVVTCGLMLAYPAEELVIPALTPLAGIVRHSLPCEEEYEVEFEYEEVCEESEIIDADALVADEPVARDEPIALDSATEDSDLPYEESFGSSEAGLSDGSFEGPANNGALGIGGGAGGAFRGRGGGCDLGTGAGGGRRRCGDAWQPSRLVPHASRVRVGDKEEIPLEGMHVDVRVEGFRARVVIDCFYRNDRQQALEGNFQIRLPNEATPYFFAFGETVRRTRVPARTAKGGLPESIGAILAAREGEWTEPREARLVPRAEAARAYGEVVRRRIDPALLEWTGADIFRARIFPLAPGKLHRIVLGYEVNLIDARCANHYRLDLPERIPDLHVDLHVTDPGAVVSPPGAAQGGHHRYWNPAPRRFSVRVPSGGAAMLRGDDPASGPYFAARFHPRLPSAPVAAAQRGVFLLDTSASTTAQAFRIWVALLRQLLERNRSTLRDFSVGFFDVDTTWWRPGFVANTPANVDALLHHVEGLTLSGATDLHRALRSTRRYEGAYDVFLLSDGASTWGEDDEKVIDAALADGHALFAYRTGMTGTDVRRLRALTRRAGGGVFSITGAAEVERAATAHAQRPWRLESVRVPGGHDLLLDGRPADVYPGQALLLVGRGRPADRAPVTLMLTRGAERRQVTTTMARTRDSDLAPRLYGQVAVAQFEALEDVTGEMKRAYATHFRIVGKTCSLLMLESEADYRRYDIVPRDDAQRVRGSSARRAVARAVDAQAGETADARARFLRRLRSIREAAGVDGGLPEALATMLEAGPQEAFAIAPVRLQDRRGRKLHVLSTLVEEAPGDVSLLRDVAFRAQALGFGGHAYYLLRRAATLRPHQPQTLADMGASLGARGRADPAIVCYEAALAYGVTARHEDFRRCTLFAYVHLLDRVVRGELDSTLQAYARTRVEVLRHELGVVAADLVVTIGWNTDRTDVDLWIHEPSGEACCYQHRATASGGRMTDDVTGGFGPEAYVLQSAPAGPYEISVQYYSSDASRASTRTRVHATIYENWGRADAAVARRTVLLESRSERQPITTLLVGALVPGYSAESMADFLCGAKLKTCPSFSAFVRR